MIKFFHKILGSIPQEQRKEFISEISRENILRLMVAQISLIVLDTILLIFYGDHTGWLGIAFILYNVIQFPLFYMVYRKKEFISQTLPKVLSYTYILVALSYACALTFYQNDPGSVQIFIYVIAMFAFSALIYMPPLISLILYLFVYIGFYLSIPVLPIGEDTLYTLRVNAFLMNIFAWLLGRIVLRARVKNFLDKKTIMEKNQLLSQLVIRDSMTMLLNHVYLYKRLYEEIERARRINYPLSIAMFDIDNFKYVNDNYGHLIGDKVIVQIARIIENTCRTTDIVGRYGGEEFAVIMPDTDLASAGVLAERIRLAVESAVYEEGVKITVSGGIAEFHHNTAEELIKRADELLFKAKQAGKNRIYTHIPIEGIS